MSTYGLCGSIAFDYNQAKYLLLCECTFDTVLTAKGSHTKFNFYLLFFFRLFSDMLYTDLKEKGSFLEKSYFKEFSPDALNFCMVFTIQCFIVVKTENATNSLVEES